MQQKLSDEEFVAALEELADVAPTLSVSVDELRAETDALLAQTDGVSLSDVERLLEKAQTFEQQTNALDANADAVNVSEEVAYDVH